MPQPSSLLAKAKKPDKVKIYTYLQANGHKKADLDKKKWDTETDIKKSLLELMGVTPEQYKASGGKI